ncbi:MAG: type II secretion system F family protein [Planctomycetaceae bacterium]|jgi:type II secretory pathway component PulF|nr:type II secretion system F family protein [Planctomycetaceae bacterium]
MSAELPLSSAGIAGNGEIDRLLALCDEISVLVRSGLPIEEALLQKNAGERRRIRDHLHQLAKKIGSGQPLADAIRNDPIFPPVYAAVVEAGIESGNLAGALDMVTQCAQTVRDARLFLIRSAIYPLILFTSLWFIFCGLFFFVGPRIAHFFEAYQATTLLFDAMKGCENHLQHWLIVMFAVPFAFWILFIIWISRSSRGMLIQSAGQWSLLGWIPWVGKATVQLQKMTFARILAMLVRASLPLDKAIFLATRVANERYWSKESQECLCQLVTKAATSDSSVRESLAAACPRSHITPLIMWTLGIPNQTLLVEGAEHYARLSQSRAEQLIFRCELFLPGIITLCFTAALAVCYVLTVFLPYSQLLNILTTYQG